ncbi:MAG: hypothetical protein GY798_30535 [Hyphomicrobiales bacterium]|nr:hypothetical protein [Hyphomicrobiales bacterium]
MSTVPHATAHHSPADAPLVPFRRRDTAGRRLTATARLRPPTHDGSPRPIEPSTGRDEISRAISDCAETLRAVAAAADLNHVSPHDHPRVTAEEAMAFAGFLLELARPLDVMLHRVLIAGADSFDILSERERRDALTIVSECAVEDWAGRFVTFAEVEAGGGDAELPEAAFFSDRYARRVAASTIAP